jgi:hypothetical protein
MTQPNITEICQNEALGQVLSNWGDFAYDQIIEALNEDDNSVLEHDDFHVWYPLEDMPNSQLADHIESLTKAFERIATKAVELNKEGN